MARKSIAPWKPTREQLAQAGDKVVPDVIGQNLRVLFCGINPGLWSGATGHHFARPGNKFWKSLHQAGFTDRLLSPFEEKEMLVRGYGVTNVVMRTTATADELEHHELLAGGKALQRKVKKYQPRILAVLGMGAYKAAFGIKQAPVGPQDHFIGETRLWVLPNPSGLNANYQLPRMVELFRDLHRAAHAEAKK